MVYEDIAGLREEIDKIDREIVCLLKKRVEITKKIGQLKANRSMDIEDTDREHEVFKNVSDASKESDLDGEFVRKIFGLIIGHCKGKEKEIFNFK